MPPSAATVAAAAALDRDQVGDVDRDRLHATRGRELLPGRLDQGLVAIPERHRGAGRQQALGDRPADALGAAGHHRPPAVEIDSIHCLAPRLL